MASLPIYSPEEYLELEARSEIRHEYFRGEIFSMSGGTEVHALLGLNCASALKRLLRGQPCRTYGSDMRVKVTASNMYTYPDVSVACPPIEKVTELGQESITNPRLIVEVLSPSTEAYDRGAKFQQYQLIPALQSYVLVSQTEYLVESFSRQDNGTWSYTSLAGIDAVCTLVSLGLELPLRDIYEDVTLAPQLRVRQELDER